MVGFEHFLYPCFGTAIDAIMTPWPPPRNLKQRHDASKMRDEQFYSVSLDGSTVAVAVPKNAKSRRMGKS